jgi:hypothetical protein
METLSLLVADSSTSSQLDFCHFAGRLRRAGAARLLAQKSDSCRFVLLAEAPEAERSLLCFLSHRRRSRFS